MEKVKNMVRYKVSEHQQYQQISASSFVVLCLSSAYMVSSVLVFYTTFILLKLRYDCLHLPSVVL